MNNFQIIVFLGTDGLKACLLEFYRNRYTAKIRLYLDHLSCSIPLYICLLYHERNVIQKSILFCICSF